MGCGSDSRWFAWSRILGKTSRFCLKRSRSSCSLFRFSSQNAEVRNWQILLRAIVIWLIMMGVETVHGILRRLFLEPVIGDLPARQLGVFIGSFIILTITYLTVRWLDARRTVEYFAVGSLWIILTISFEIGLGRSIGLSWRRIFSDYDPSSGGLMIIGVLAMLIAPFLIAKFRG